MDLCGETFSPQSVAQHDVDSMAEYMEADYTPDPQQYKTRYKTCMFNPSMT